MTSSPQEIPKELMKIITIKEVFWMVNDLKNLIQKY